jgi:hypothetical protein
MANRLDLKYELLSLKQSYIFNRERYVGVSNIFCFYLLFLNKEKIVFLYVTEVFLAKMLIRYMDAFCSVFCWIGINFRYIN